MRLEDEANLAVAHGGQAPIIQSAQVLSVQRH